MTHGNVDAWKLYGFEDFLFHYDFSVQITNMTACELLINN